MGKGPKRQSSKKDTQMANESMKRRSASIMRERPIKVMTTYHLTPIKMVTVKENTSVGGKVKKLEPCAMKVAQKMNTM